MVEFYQVERLRAADGDARCAPVGAPRTRGGRGAVGGRLIPMKLQGGARHRSAGSGNIQCARMSQAQLFRSLARNKNALRASMITREVMGPPKGLR